MLALIAWYAVLEALESNMHPGQIMTVAAVGFAPVAIILIWRKQWYPNANKRETA
jgi:hypothetical protein